jgi:hypothetical protein
LANSFAQTIIYNNGTNNPINVDNRNGKGSDSGTPSSPPKNPPQEKSTTRSPSPSSGRNFETLSLSVSESADLPGGAASVFVRDIIAGENPASTVSLHSKKGLETRLLQKNGFLSYESGKCFYRLNIMDISPTYQQVKFSIEKGNCNPS